jgi:hypothetical protein
MDLTAEIANGHGYLGYLVLAAVLGVVVYALVQARGGAAYSGGAPRLVGLLLALQWLYGILVYVQISGWNGDWALAYVHPLAMTGAVAMSGIATSRARALPDAAAWTVVARLQGIALVLVAVGVLAVAL